MRWEGRERSKNVDDRRGRGGGNIFGRSSRGGPSIRIPRGGGGGVRRAGGGSIILVIVVAIGLWIFAGINPLQLLDMLSRSQGGGGPVASAPSQARTPEQTAMDDERAAFMAVVLKETENTWSRIFQESGSRYDPPQLVLYSGFVQTSCGFGSAAVGPYYCPADQKVYVDLSFFDMLSRKLGAPGDFAQAYVLAHEVGHHVQNQTGVLGRFNEARQRMGERASNAESIKVELQADCYAGVWAHAADRTGIVEDGDIDEALGAAAAVGDDMMQRRSQGYVVPESFNHGTAAQRSKWFRTGYQSGNPADCDTFAAL
ncbi:neutral zinc metallopeptidase [Acuticoccus sp. MNP-M23]|uniref:KPN_02809 family neutral zinc metallopeptidase n=1 Tax=Acuticoccus sp. MNP-M23 TaxID=3072793 RepID=UPI002815E780|nr:neutral zinc metallopeptidase [Acuticoccus sp. MNP-M23]WMS40785.1 neutral zinc metallopeptidase [Acuticoccus sp. MNP-M23]